MRQVEQTMHRQFHIRHMLTRQATGGTYYRWEWGEMESSRQQRVQYVVARILGQNVGVERDFTWDILEGQ